MRAKFSIKLKIQLMMKLLIKKTYKNNIVKFEKDIN